MELSPHKQSAESKIICVKALVVEDDTEQLKALVKLLKSPKRFADFHVTEVLEAKFGYRAENILAQHKDDIDIIILDDRLPMKPGNRDRHIGLKIADYARGKGITCPIIFYTGTVDTNKEMDRFMNGPIKINDLVPKAQGLGFLTTVIEKQLKVYHGVAS